MQRRLPGAAGVRVSPLCLGAMMFGTWGDPDHEDSTRIIHRALDAGNNFMTRWMCTVEESEGLVVEAITGRRDDVVLATTSFKPMGEDSNNGPRRWIVQAVEDSQLRRGTDGAASEPAQTRGHPADCRPSPRRRSRRRSTIGRHCHQPPRHHLGDHRPSDHRTAGYIPADRRCRTRQDVLVASMRSPSLHNHQPTRHQLRRPPPQTSSRRHCPSIHHETGETYEGCT